MSIERHFVHAACDVPDRLETPIKISDIKKLRVGDITFISGEIYTARDRAHIKIRQDKNHLPFNLAGACVYHSGPIIIKPNNKYKVVSAGPTTSVRMEEYVPDVVKLGVRAIIGKGGLSDKAVDIMKGRCLYLAFTGGCGALAQRKIVDVLQVYYPELGETEAVWRLKVEDFGPLIVAIDSYSHNVYKEVETYSNRRLHELVRETSTRCG